MRVFMLILKEVLHRKVNFLLSALGVVAAVAILVAFFTTGEASKVETTRLMRDIGYNLRIIPKNTDMETFWTAGYSEETMPEEYVRRFLEKKALSYAHLLATLQRRIDWNGGPVLLTGIASEVDMESRKKSPMIFEVKEGELHVGFETAKRLGLRAGEEVGFMGKKFRVASALAETGSLDDLRVYARLSDVQELLGLSGQINEIKALECLCKDPNINNLAMLREDLAKILPEAKVVRLEPIAEAREKQRFLVENTFAMLLPVIMVLCALWVGALAVLNTRERQTEIGILRALGYGSRTISSLFLGKAILVGILGAALGFVCGTAVAMQYGPEIFKVTPGIVRADYRLLILALLAAPLFTALSAFIPTMAAVTRDPAATLRVE